MSFDDVENHHEFVRWKTNLSLFGGASIVPLTWVKIDTQLEWHDVNSDENEYKYIWQSARMTQRKDRQNGANVDYINIYIYIQSYSTEPKNVCSLAAGATRR